MFFEIQTADKEKVVSKPWNSRKYLKSIIYT